MYIYLTGDSFFSIQTLFQVLNLSTIQNCRRKRFRHNHNLYLVRSVRNAAAIPIA